MNKKQQDQIWGSLLKGPGYKKGIAYKLAKISYERVGQCPEVDLFVSILIDAAKEKDWHFLESEYCRILCELIELHYEYVIKIFLYINNCIDFKINNLNIEELM